jgi:hypothetical protein
MNLQLSIGNGSEMPAQVLAFRDRSREDMMAAEGVGSRKDGCRYCGRSLSFLNRISGAKFCSALHEESARRRRVEQMGRRLLETDPTVNLSRSNAMQPLVLTPADSVAERLRPATEFRRSQTMVLPQRPTEPSKLAVVFGPDRLVAIAKGPLSPQSDARWVVRSAPNGIMPQVPSILSACPMPALAEA